MGILLAVFVPGFYDYFFIMFATLYLIPTISAYSLFFIRLFMIGFLLYRSEYVMFFALLIFSRLITYSIYYFIMAKSYIQNHVLF